MEIHALRQCQKISFKITVAVPTKINGIAKCAYCEKSQLFANYVSGSLGDRPLNPCLGIPWGQTLAEAWGQASFFLMQLLRRDGKYDIIHAARQECRGTHSPATRTAAGKC